MHIGADHHCAPLITSLLLAALVPAPRPGPAVQSQPDTEWAATLEAIRHGRRLNSSKLTRGYLVWTCRTHQDGFGGLSGVADTQSRYEFWWEPKRAASEATQEWPVGGTGSISGTSVYRRRAAYDHAARRFVQITTSGSPSDVRVGNRPEFTLHADYFKTFGVRSPFGDDWTAEQFGRSDAIVQFDVVERDGRRLLRATGRSRQEQGKGRCESYLDPQRGWNLVAWDWFDADGHLYVQGIQTLAEVTGGAWIPTERDERAIDPATGKITLRHHFSVEVGKCRFNSMANLPEHVFRIYAIDGYAGMVWHEAFKALGFRPPPFSWAYVLLGVLLIVVLPLFIWLRKRIPARTSRERDQAP